MEESQLGSDSAEKGSLFYLDCGAIGIKASETLGHHQSGRKREKRAGPKRRDDNVYQIVPRRHSFQTISKTEGRTACCLATPHEKRLDSPRCSEVTFR